MINHRAAPKPNGGTTYRISELIAASGASRGMIKYYLRAGLLPPAEKPRPKLSLYTQTHLDLIGLITRYQDQTRLSLSEIAKLFAAKSYDTNAIEIELLSAKDSVGSDQNILPLKHVPSNARTLNFPAKFLRQLKESSLVQDSGQPDENEDQLVGLLWAAHDGGMPLAFFKSAREKLAELADLEVKALIAIKRPGVSFDDTVETVTDIDRIINRWIITEKNIQIRRQFQQVIDNSERAISTMLSTIYRPSPLFRKRHGVDAALNGLITTLDPSPGQLQHSHDLGVGCLFLGNYDQTITVAEATLSSAPGDAVATALIALAHGLKGNVDQAFEYGVQLQHSEVQHPVVMQARILSLLLKAAKLGGIADSTELMRNAGQLFLELQDGTSDHAAEKTLILARANVAFADFANSRSQAISALQVLLKQLEHGATELNELSIKDLRESLLVVQRIYTLYYLGILHGMNGDHAKARPFLEQVIQLDPASNFAEFAYQSLGQLER